VECGEQFLTHSLRNFSVLFFLTGLCIDLSSAALAEFNFYYLHTKKGLCAATLASTGGVIF